MQQTRPVNGTKRTRKRDGIVQVEAEGLDGVGGHVNGMVLMGWDL